MASARREAVLHALEAAGRTAHAEAVAGADGLSAALLRRGWDAVLYSGDGPAPLPARRAMTLVRLADPRLPFIVVAPELRAGDLSALIRGFGPDMVLAPDVARPARGAGRAARRRPRRALGRRPRAAAPPRPEGGRAARRRRPRARRARRAGAGHARARARLVLRRRVAGRRRRGRRDAALRRDLARRGRRPGRRRLRHRLARHGHRPGARPRRPRMGVRPPGVDRGHRRRRQRAARRPGAGRGPQRRGRLPHRARGRLHRRDRVLRAPHPRAGRADRRDVRDGLRPARPVLRAAPAAGRREPPRGGDAPRRTRPRAALPRRGRHGHRRARPRRARPAHQPQGLLGHRPAGVRAARARLVRARRARPRARCGARLLRALHARRGRGGRPQRERDRAAGRRYAPGLVAQRDPARRRRQPDRHAVLRRGRDGAPPGRAADHLPRLPRPAHGPAQPLAARGAPQARAGALAPHRVGRRAAAPRARRVQARQRLAGTRRGRRAPVPARDAPAGLRPHDGPARPHGRRRVPAPAGRSPGRSDDDRRARGRPARRRPRRALHGRRRRVPGVRLDRHRAVPARRGGRGDAPGPGGLRHAPREAARPRRLGRLPAGRRRSARAPLDGGADAARAVRGRVPPALSADLRRRVGRGGRRRGAPALARPRARRPRPAGRVHPRGRGDRADRVDRRLGRRARSASSRWSGPRAG